MDARDDLVGDRAAPGSELLGGNPLVSLGAEEHDLVLDRDAGMSVTSTMHMFMQTRPRTGARRPRTRTCATAGQAPVVSLVVAQREDGDSARAGRPVGAPVADEPPSGSA